ncbi:MAG: GntR family transcriptional regulator [Phycisphaerales bacterium]
MLLQIDYHSGQPIYRQVVDQIRRQVVTGQLREGEQLPSVRDLAAQLRVNPMTISKVYSLLEMEGLLDRRRGVGLFVATLAKDKAGRTKADMLQEALTKAVVMAVQLGIPEDKVRDMLTRLYQRYDSRMRRQENE